MREDLKPIYRFILNREIVTAKVLAIEFNCSQSVMRRKLDILTENEFIKTEKIQDFELGKWTKVFKSPLAGEVGCLVDV